MQQCNRMTAAIDKLNSDDAGAPGRFGPHACRALHVQTPAIRKPHLNLYIHDIDKPRQPDPAWPAPSHWVSEGGRRPKVGSSAVRFARPGTYRKASQSMQHSHDTCGAAGTLAGVGPHEGGIHFFRLRLWMVMASRHGIATLSRSTRGRSAGPQHTRQPQPGEARRVQDKL